MIKQSLFRVARSPLFSGLVTFLEKLEHRPNLLRVLTYHRVDDPEATPNLDPNLISATPEQFAGQMEHLAEYANVVTVQQVLQAVRDEVPLPSRSVLITFDDAYQDFAEHAWPTLRRLGLPALMFVPTAFPDQPRRFWWDTVFQAVHQGVGSGEFEVSPGESSAQVFRRLVRELKMLSHADLLERVQEFARLAELSEPVSSVMTWETLMRLSEQGLTLGAHTQTHPLMNRVPVAVAVEEAIGSLRELQSRLPDVPPVFAYPGGAFSQDLVDALRPHFQLAFTTCRGINDLGRADRLRLRRINVGRHTPASLVRAQMLAGIRHLNRRWPLQSAV